MSKLSLPSSAAGLELESLRWGKRKGCLWLLIPFAGRKTEKKGNTRTHRPSFDRRDAGRKNYESPRYKHLPVKRDKERKVKGCGSSSLHKSLKRKEKGSSGPPLFRDERGRRKRDVVTSKPVYEVKNPATRDRGGVLDTRKGRSALRHSNLCSSIVRKEKIQKSPCFQ